MNRLFKGIIRSVIYYLVVFLILTIASVEITTGASIGIGTVCGVLGMLSVPVEDY